MADLHLGKGMGYTMKKRVLIVEDNLDDRVLMTQIVEKMLHHTCVAVGDGAEAVHTISRESFDLVLLDLQLPRLHGWYVASLLRKMDHYKNVPIIAVTAYDHTNARIRTFAAGCNMYITKPINIDSLIDVISTYLPRVSDN